MAGYVDLDPEIIAEATAKQADKQSASKLHKRELNNNDPLYAQIRNLNFGELGPLLNRLAREVSSGYEERHQAQTVSQIKEYMKKLTRKPHPTSYILHHISYFSPLMTWHDDVA